MATIVARKGASGPSFQARVRLTRDGELIHQESKTFLTRAAVREWAKRREVELQNPDTLTVAKAQGLTLAKLIRWYIDAYESVSPWQRSKQNALEFLEEHPIGQRDPFRLTPDVLITMCDSADWVACHLRPRQMT